MKNKLANIVVSLFLTIFFGSICICPCFSQTTDCQKFLKSFLQTDPLLSSIEVTMVTLNSKGVASFTVTRLYYVPAKIVHGRQFPGVFRTLEAGEFGIDQPKFDFGKQVQVFSDRYGKGDFTGVYVGLKGHSSQKFDLNSADDLALEITDEPEVKVTITLRSWNSKKVHFAASCQEGGFLQGQTPDVKYILYIKGWAQ